MYKNLEESVAKDENQRLLLENVELSEIKPVKEREDNDQDTKEGGKEEKEMKDKNKTILQLIKNILKKDFEGITNDQSKQEDLEEAMTEGKAETVKKLIEAGAPIDVYEWDEKGDIITPLTFAANIDRLDIFCLVLLRAIKEGVDDDEMYVNTAMQRACTKNSVLIAKMLMKRNVNFKDIYDEYEGDPPKRETKHAYNDPEASYLHFCAFFGSREVLKLLLEKHTDSVDIDQKDSEGNTALHLASRNGYSTCVSLLIQKNAKVDEVNKAKRTALFVAIQNAPEELIYNLIRAGADVNVEDGRGLTPLFIAAIEGRDTLIPILVNNGANVDARNRFYRTPLMMACRGGNAAAVRELLLSGASIDAKDKNRADAFTSARNKKQDDALSVIVRAHAGVENFKNLGWHKVLTKELYKSLLTMLDCLIVPELDKNRGEFYSYILQYSLIN